MNITQLKDIVFSGNRAWELMYFDEVQETGKYQITFTGSPDRPYLNCAHIIYNLTEEDISTVEFYFSSRNEPSRIYITDLFNADFPNKLSERLYQQIVSDEEFWYELKIDRKYNIYDYFKGPQLSLNLRQVNIHTDELDEFMALNKRCNGLSVQQVRHSLDKVRCFDNLSLDKTLDLYSIYIDNKLVATGALTCIGDKCFFSEGATHPDYRNLGLHSVLVAHRLNICNERKKKKAYVCCDTEAYSNHTFKKFNFKHVFTRQLWEKDLDFNGE